MTTTSTSSTAPASAGRINDELIERAHRAYRAAGELEQPAAGSQVHVITGGVRITLGNINGDLATYELRDARMKRIDAVGGAA